MIQTVKERAAAIRAATPNVLENLFEMQNRICDLCNYPIQEIMLAALDHSIPVIRYAKALDIAIEDAIRECNDAGNLRAAHSICNNKKKGKTRKEWFALNLDKKVGEPRIWTDAELLEFQFRLGAGGRIGGRGRSREHNIRHGRVIGRMCAEKKIGVCGQSVEKMRENGRKSAELAGSEGMAERGRKGARKGGLISGRRHKENGTGIFAPEHKGKGSAIAGRMAVESGRLASYRTPEHQSKAAAAAGRKNAESGQIQELGHKWGPEKGKIQGIKNRKECKGIFSPDYDRAATGRANKEAGVGIFAPGYDKGTGGRVAGHTRWHVKRGIVNPICPLCIESLAVA